MELKDYAAVGASLVSIARNLVDCMKPKSPKTTDSIPKTPVSSSPKRIKFRRTVEEWELITDDQADHKEEK